MNQNTPYYEQLRNTRLEKRFTTQEIADELQITKQALSLKELGKRKFTTEETAKLCKKYKINIRNLNI